MDNETLQEHVKEKVASTNHRFDNLSNVPYPDFNLGDISVREKEMDPDFNTKRFLLLLINFNFTRPRLATRVQTFQVIFRFPKKLPTKAIPFAGIQSGFCFI